MNRTVHSTSLRRHSAAPDRTLRHRHLPHTCWVALQQHLQRFLRSVSAWILSLTVRLHLQRTIHCWNLRLNPLRTTHSILGSHPFLAHHHTARGKPNARSPPFGGPHFFFFLCTYMMLSSTKQNIFAHTQASQRCTSSGTAGRADASKHALKAAHTDTYMIGPSSHA